MRPLFGIDLSEDKKNEAFHIEAFEVQKPSSALRASLDAAMEDSNKMEERAKLPWLLRGAKTVFGVLGLAFTVVLVDVMTGADGVGFAQAYEDAPWFFWIAVGGLILWGILTYLSVRRGKRVEESQENSILESKLKSIPEAIYQELGVPADVPGVDVLQYRYKVKDGKVKPILIPTTSTGYIHLSVKFYAREGNLYFATLDGKFALPLSAVREIRKIDKKIAAIGWTKEKTPNKEPYSQYKIKFVNELTVVYKPYYELHLSFEGEDWLVEFPCYELPAFEAATGLKAIS